jgi:hypothetical protein
VATDSSDDETQVLGARRPPTRGRSPSRPRRWEEVEIVPLVSLREMKAVVERLEPNDPLRILVLGEPDELPRPEYAAKVVGWFRLLRELPRSP